MNPIVFTNNKFEYRQTKSVYASPHFPYNFFGCPHIGFEFALPASGCYNKNTDKSGRFS